MRKQEAPQEDLNAELRKKGVDAPRVSRTKPRKEPTKLCNFNFPKSLDERLEQYVFDHRNDDVTKTSVILGQVEKFLSSRGY